MANRNYYVLCDNNCKFPAMTKEQVLSAIAQAVSTGKITDIDTGFVTTIKEQNKGAALTFWVGTQAEKNALAKEEENCFYIVTDDTSKADIAKAIAELQKAVAGFTKYELPTAGKDTLGGVKTTSAVTNTSGHTPCPIVGGVPYYKNTTYETAKQDANGLMSKEDKTKLDGMGYTYGTEDLEAGVSELATGKIHFVYE